MFFVPASLVASISPRDVPINSYGLPGKGPKSKQQIGGGFVGPGVSFGGMSSFSEGISNASSGGVDASGNLLLGVDGNSVSVGDGEEAPAAVAALADKYREQVRKQVEDMHGDDFVRCEMKTQEAGKQQGPEALSQLGRTCLAWK